MQGFDSVSGEGMWIPLLDLLVGAYWGLGESGPQIRRSRTLLFEMLDLRVLLSFGPGIGASVQGLHFPLGHTSSALLAGWPASPDGSPGQIFLCNLREHRAELLGAWRLLRMAFLNFIPPLRKNIASHPPFICGLHGAHGRNRERSRGVRDLDVLGQRLRPQR